MDQLFVKRSSMAWFTLAECVLRKEQKKAFRLFKLLSYSIKDPGLLLQLEGDLFLSFSEDLKAFACYNQAIELYERCEKRAAAKKLHTVISYTILSTTDGHNLQTSK